jgi:hypothetical protein
MRSVRSEVWLLILLSFYSCQLAPNNNTNPYLGWIEIQSPQGWVLQVHPDGSGSLNCRAVGHCRVPFPEGTITYSTLVQSVAKKGLAEKGPFYLSWLKAGQTHPHHQWTNDTAWASVWFEEAYEAVLDMDDHRLAQRRLRKHWYETPPAGVKKPNGW